MQYPEEMYLLNVMSVTEKQREKNVKMKNFRDIAILRIIKNYLESDCKVMIREDSV